MKICIFGDSITWGSCDNAGGGWVDHLKRFFMEKDIGVYNLGISGKKTEDLIPIIKKEAEARGAGMIIFAIGINDAQFIHSKGDYYLSESEFEENIKELYKIAREVTEKIIFLGITSVDESKTCPIPWGPNKSYRNERIKKLDGIIENFCRQKDVKFIPLNDILDESELYDGIHPGVEGHVKIYERVRGELAKDNTIIENSE